MVLEYVFQGQQNSKQQFVIVLKPVLKFVVGVIFIGEICF